MPKGCTLPYIPDEEEKIEPCKKGYILGKNLTDSLVWIYAPVFLDSENDWNIFKESPALLEIDIILSESQISTLE